MTDRRVEAFERICRAVDRQFFDKAAITKLSDMLTAIGGKPVTIGTAYETDQFWTRMENCAYTYVFAAHTLREFPLANPKQVQNAYQKLANSVSKARIDLETLLDKSSYGDFLYVAAVGNCTDKLFDFEVVQTKINNIRKQIEELESWIVDALEKATTAAKDYKGGRPKTSLLPVAVQLLADVYEEYTGRRAGVTNDPVNERKGGPFVRFVVAFLEHVEPEEKKREAPGQTIRNILIAHKAKFKLQRRPRGNIT